jgi:hypothetical protein
MANLLFFFCLFTFSLGADRVTANVLQIGDGRDFQHKSLFGDLNFLLPQNCQAEMKPRL